MSKYGPSRRLPYDKYILKIKINKQQNKKAPMIKYELDKYYLMYNINKSGKNRTHP